MLAHARRDDLAAIVPFHQPGRTLVVYFGSHHYLYAQGAQLSAWPERRRERLQALREFGVRYGCAPRSPLQ